jgi:hypothetical protein
MKHPRLVLKNQRDAEVSQYSSELSVEPFLVSDFDCEFVALRQPLQKWYEPVQKITLGTEDSAVEERKLENHRPELGAEERHGFYELLEFGLTSHEKLFVGNQLRNFD